MTEVRGQKTEDRRQRSEDRGQRTEDRGQMEEVGSRNSAFGKLRRDKGGKSKKKVRR